MRALRPGTAARAGVHAGTGLCALLLGVLSPTGAIVAAGIGVLLGWVVFPLTGIDAALRRPGEGWWNGLRTYPLAVLGLVLWLPPAEAAAAWGTLAFGDSAAALVGQGVPSPRLLGHPKLTWSGTLAHVAVGGLAAWGLGLGVTHLAGMQDALDPGAAPDLWRSVLAASGAAAASAIPLPPDDNLPGAAAAGGVLHISRGLL